MLKSAEKTSNMTNWLYPDEKYPEAYHNIETLQLHAAIEISYYNYSKKYIGWLMTN